MGRVIFHRAIGCMGWLWGAERGAILPVHGAGSQGCWFGDQGGPKLVPAHWWAGKPSMIIDESEDSKMVFARSCVLMVE